MAFVFVDISIHVGNSGLLLAAAAAFGALAVTARGPLGMVRICPPWLHLTLLISVAAVVAVAPVLPAVRPDIEGIIVIEFGAVGLIRLATLTDMRPSRARRSSPSSRRPDGTVIEATATDATGPATGPTPGASDRPGTDTRAGAAARWAGRAAGVASVSGRRAVAKHGPEAEAQVKRAIRGAGRWTGRLTSPADGETCEPTDR